MGRDRTRGNRGKTNRPQVGVRVGTIGEERREVESRGPLPPPTPVAGGLPDAGSAACSRCRRRLKTPIGAAAPGLRAAHRPPPTPLPSTGSGEGRKGKGGEPDPARGEGGRLPDPCGDSRRPRIPRLHCRRVEEAVARRRRCRRSRLPCCPPPVGLRATRRRHRGPPPRREE
uniref:Uncharacterized protein n=1 Tax=Oryza sativa subsp. japonica TaxID=39947 RepID=Q6K648_ORYSJ|nr:hypothetical protein [Oryza sativa Japonica Group]